MNVADKRLVEVRCGEPGSNGGGQCRALVASVERHRGLVVIARTVMPDASREIVAGGKRLLRETPPGDLGSPMEDHRQRLLDLVGRGRSPDAANHLWHFDHHDACRLELPMVVKQLEDHRAHLTKLIAEPDLVRTKGHGRGPTLSQAVHRVPLVAELLRKMEQAEASEPEQTSALAAEALAMCEELLERFRSPDPPPLTFPKAATHWACKRNHESLLLVRSELERAAIAAERDGKKRTLVATIPRTPRTLR